MGDLCLELGLTNGNAQRWSKQHPEFEKLLWAEPHPKNHWPEFLAYVRHAVIDDYRKRKAKLIASGVPETEAMHTAADAAVNDLKYRTRQRRRVERDTLQGVGGHELLLGKYRKGAKLTDAHSRRIAKRLVQVNRWVAMERRLRDVGYDEAEIAEMMRKLMGAFKESDEKGQAHWVTIREKILRRRADADAFAKAQEVEAVAVKSFAKQRRRAAPLVAE